MTFWKAVSILLKINAVWIVTVRRLETGPFVVKESATFIVFAFP